MNIIENLLTVNAHTRPAKKLAKLLGVVIHWTANPQAGAMANRNYFESLKNGLAGYASAHYVIGQEGEIVRCIPEDEIAYHCGTARNDPKSGRTYTDEARSRFGEFAANPLLSPNLCTIGIELCPYDYDGNFTKRTLESAAELCADILRRNGLTADAVTTHHDVVGWKGCPLLWTKKPELLDEFRRAVTDRLVKDYIA